MTAQTLQTPDYEAYERGILTLHELALAGRDGSREADELRDRLLSPWSNLTPEQRDFGDGISADLYMMEPGDGEVYEPASDAQRTPQRLGLAIKAAWDRQDWAAVLELLRKGPAFFTPEHVAHLRASAYDNLGRAAVALAFARHALELAPADAANQMMVLDLLARAGRKQEATSLAWQCATEPGRPAKVVIFAAGRLFPETRQQPRDVARAAWGKLVSVLDRVIDAPEVRSDPDAGELLAHAHMILGGCHDNLGDAAAARREYEAVLEIGLRDRTFLAVRAALREYVTQRFASNSGEASGTERDFLFDIATSFTPRTAA